MLMDRTEIHSFQLTALLGWVSAALFFFVWFSADGLELVQMGHVRQSSTSGNLKSRIPVMELDSFNKLFILFQTIDFTVDGAWKVPALLVLDGFTNFIQNVVAFAVLFLVTPTSYAVGNITKRPIIIAVSIYVFKNAVTAMNILGLVITVIGASLYTYFELDEDSSKGPIPKDVGSSKESGTGQPMTSVVPAENPKTV